MSVSQASNQAVSATLFDLFHLQSCLCLYETCSCLHLMPFIHASTCIKFIHHASACMKIIHHRHCAMTWMYKTSSFCSCNGYIHDGGPVMTKLYFKGWRKNLIWEWGAKGRCKYTFSPPAIWSELPILSVGWTGKSPAPRFLARNVRAGQPSFLTATVNQHQGLPKAAPSICN